MHPPAPEGKGELINRKVHGFCKLCWAKCPVYDLEMVRGAQGTSWQGKLVWVPWFKENSTIAQSSV